MDRKDIEILLDRYFEGISTLREEAQLREYFNGENVDPGLAPYQDLFRHFETSRQEELSPEFDQRLMQQLAEAEPERPRIRRLWPVLARVAAVLLLAFGVWWFYPQPEPATQQAGIDWSKYEPESPEEAYRLTRMALMKVSGEINEGASKAAREMDKFQEVTRFFKN